MKKVITIVIIIIVSTIITACANDPNYKTPDERSKQQQINVVECFKNKDAEKFKKMFCPKIISKGNIDNEIQEAFNFIDGDIVSYDEPRGRIGGKTIQYGRTTECEFRGKIVNIKTDTGHLYHITFTSYDIFNDDADKVGISELGVFSDNGIEHTIGDFYFVNPE